jgi:4-hydroxyisophthalate hydroxylase
VFDALGHGFTLLAFGEKDETLASFAHAAGKLGVPLTIVGSQAGTVSDAYEARLVLVRPDQYVAWASKGDIADPHAVMAKAIGAKG